MSQNVKQWLEQVSTESNDAPVIVQEGETPKEDFSAASAEATADVDTAKPAAAGIPAASEGAPAGKDIDQGHQTVHVSAESNEAGEGESKVEGAVSAVTEEVTKAKVEAAEGETGGVPEIADNADDQVKPKEIEVSVETGDQPAVVPAPVEGEVQPEGVTPTEGEVVDVPAAGVVVETDVELEVSAEDDLEPVELEVTPEPAEVLQAEAQAVANDIDNFTDMSAALEAYDALLSRALQDEQGISGITAEAIRIGLESIDESFGGVEVIPSLESFGETCSRQTATTISLESLREKMGVVLKATKAAIDKLFRILYDLWVEMTGGAARAQKRLEKIAERVKALSVQRVNKQVTVNGTARLSVGIDFVGNDAQGVRDIQAIADYIYSQYPTQAESLIRAAAAHYQSVKVGLFAFSEEAALARGAALLDFASIPGKHMKPIKGAQPAKRAELPASLQKYEGVVTSHKVAGNFALVQFIKQITARFGTGDAGADQAVAIATMFHRVFNIQFVPLNVRSNPKAETYKLPTKVELQAMVKELDALLGQVEKSKENKTKYEKIRTEVDGILDDIFKASSSIGEQVTLPRWTNPLVNAMQSLTRLLVQPGGQFNGYVVSSANAFMAVLEYNLKHFEEAAEAATGGAQGGNAKLLTA
jgi:hypothetical protein